MKGLFFLLSFILIGCRSQETPPKIVEKPKDIIVGMTYDEVEAILGKPKQIGRGANQLKDVDDLSLEQLNALDFDSARANISDPKLWPGPQTVETVGQLIYVSWSYDAIAYDTTYMFQRSKVSKMVKKYYIDEYEVSAEEYGMVDNGYQYFNANDEPITHLGYSQLIAQNGTGPYSREVTTRTKTGSRLVNGPAERRYFRVAKKYTVLFDASSGRVTDHGFYPLFIENLYE